MKTYDLVYTTSRTKLAKATKRAALEHGASVTSIPGRKGQLVLKPKKTGNFKMTNSAFPTFDGANRSAVEASLEFGRFRVLLRQRQLLADGVPIELGTRAFELLLALLAANGSLVSKEQLLTRVWPGIAVAKDTVKVHVCALRKALGEDRDYIRTEFGRGYRFIAAVHSRVAWSRRQRSLRWRPSQLRSCSLDIPVGDRRTAGRLIALADP
jgi:DNA-binding winged helix-turn-helix (wHTH) protein